MDQAWRGHPIALGAGGKVLRCPPTALAAGSASGIHMRSREASVPTWTTVSSSWDLPSGQARGSPCGHFPQHKCPEPVPGGLKVPWGAVPSEPHFPPGGKSRHSLWAPLWLCVICSGMQEAVYAAPGTQSLPFHLLPSSRLSLPVNLPRPLRPCLGEGVLTSPGRGRVLLVPSLRALVIGSSHPAAGLAKDLPPTLCPPPLSCWVGDAGGWGLLASLL